MSMNKEERGMKVQNLSQNYEVRRLTHADVDSVLSIYSKNELYYQYHPQEVTREAVIADMEALPPHKTKDDKYFIGFFQKGKLIAVMDLMLHYPKRKVAFIGLLMMDLGMQKQGIGTRIVEECASYLGKQGFEKLRLAIDKGNPQSEHFWTKNHFIKTGEAYPNEIATYIPMERML